MFVLRGRTVLAAGLTRRSACLILRLYFKVLRTRREAEQLKG